MKKLDRISKWGSLGTFFDVITCPVGSRDPPDNRKFSLRPGKANMQF